MTCLICGGQTLSGAKLCKPCRAALRRARDDTVSELMPLPRRMDALAWQQPTGVSSAAALDMGPGAVSGRASLADLIQRARAAPHRAVGLVLLVLAVGWLAYTATRQVRLESESNETRKAATAAPVHQPTVSPTTLAAAARVIAPVEEAAPAVEPEPAMPVVVRAAKPRIEPRRVAPSRAAPVQSKPAATPIVASKLDEPVTAPQAVAPAETATPKGDRWQRLSATLAGCTSTDLFKRASCERAARVQYCDGDWDQNPLCAGGIANDRGQ